MSDQSYLLFNAGGMELAADSASVHCVHDGLIVQAEDDTRDWFLGLAVADDRLLPITDLGSYLNGNVSLGRIIEVARHFGIAGLKIDEVHGVSKKPSERYEPDQNLAEVSRSLKSMAVYDFGKHHRLIDIASLLQSSRFLNVQPETA